MELDYTFYPFTAADAARGHPMETITSMKKAAILGRCLNGISYLAR